MTSKKPKKIASKTVRLRRAYRHAVIPHKANQYRPHLIRRWGLVAVLTAVIILQAIPRPPQEVTVLGEEVDVTSQSLLDETNVARLKEGVAPLTIDDRLAAAATGKAKHMFELQYWAHTAPDGTTPWFWLREVNYRYSYAGENLARGYQTSSALITAWMNSPEHRDNMLNPNYEEVGFAVIEGRLQDETTKLVVAMYGTPLRAGSSGTTQTVLAAEGTVSPITHIGIALQSLTPTLLASLLLLLLALVVSLAAHSYRKKLPKHIQTTWRRHHGLYKSLGMALLIVVLIALYSDGQII